MIEGCEKHLCMQVRTLANPEQVLQRLVDLCVSLARCGLIHGDFNEFNLLVDENENITLIGKCRVAAFAACTCKMH